MESIMQSRQNNPYMFDQFDTILAMNPNFFDGVPLRKNNCHTNNNNNNHKSCDFMNEGGTGDILYLSNVKVKKEFIGFGYGRCLVQRIIDTFGKGECRIIIKPFPLQWNRLARDTDEKEKKFAKDNNKVVQIWKSMGFVQLGTSPYYGRNESFPHPKMSQFCKCAKK